MVAGSGEDTVLRGWLHDGELLAISTLAWAEFLCGPLEEVHVQLASSIVSRKVSFRESDAIVAARLFNQTGRRRGSLIDCMIASVAIRADATLATANPSDFRRFAGDGLRCAS